MPFYFAVVVAGFTFAEPVSVVSFLLPFALPPTPALKSFEFVRRFPFSSSETRPFAPYPVDGSGAGGGSRSSGSSGASGGIGKGGPGNGYGGSCGVPIAIKLAAIPMEGRSHRVLDRRALALANAAAHPFLDRDQAEVVSVLVACSFSGCLK